MIAGAFTGGVVTCWARFTGVSGLSGSTIDSAVYKAWGNTGSAGSPLTKIFADDSAAPTAPTTEAGHNNKTRTTAGVDWDGVLTNDVWNDSPSLNAVMQELADSHDPSAIQVLHDDDGSPQDDFDYMQYDSYNQGSTVAPKLDIDYTAGGVTTRRYSLPITGVG